MDFHLDAESLMGLPNVNIFACYQKEGFIILELELLNSGIGYSHCQNYTVAKIIQMIFSKTVVWCNL